MPVITLAELKAALPRGARLMGLDLGEKTIGLAVCDPGFTVATPVETLRRTKLTAELRTLRGIAAKRKAAGRVLGLPVNMDGRERPHAHSGLQFPPPLH